MKAVIQRVKHCKTIIDDRIYSSIEKGLLILIGFTNDDGKDNRAWFSKKITELRIFEDENNKMNLSILDIQGEIMLISQFTLYASTRKGNRPSFIEAGNPKLAEKEYELLFQELNNRMPGKIKKGKFGSEMFLDFINYGPVTIILDSNDKPQ